MNPPKTYVVYKLENFEPYYIRTSSTGIQTFCWSIKYADKFHKKEAEDLVVMLQKRRLQLYYFENISEIVKPLLKTTV